MVTPQGSDIMGHPTLAACDVTTPDQCEGTLRLSSFRNTYRFGKRYMTPNYLNWSRRRFLFREWTECQAEPVETDGQYPPKSNGEVERRPSRSNLKAPLRSLSNQEHWDINHNFSSHFSSNEKRVDFVMGRRSSTGNSEEEELNPNLRIPYIPPEGSSSSSSAQHKDLISGRGMTSSSWCLREEDFRHCPRNPKTWRRVSTSLSSGDNYQHCPREPKTPRKASSNISTGMNLCHCPRKSKTSGRSSTALSSETVSWLQCFLAITFLFLLSPVKAFCPRGCECDYSVLKVLCINADLDTIPILLNPDTKDLDLSHNRLKTILQGFIFYHNLQYLDLSHNELVSLGSQNFASQNALHTLVVNNNKISRIHAKTFAGLPGLSNLDISDNYIELIENNAFSSLTTLKMLDLSNNQIKNLTSATFAKLSGLKILNLCKNQLREINADIFSPLTELQDLDLCSNKISAIHASAFSIMSNLVHLSLHSNKVKFFHELAFNGLDSLKMLDLRDNAFSEVPTQHLKNLHSLEELDLSLNSFTSLISGTFSQLSNLRSLQISHCDNLTSISPGAFANLTKLHTLVISFNAKLDVIGKGVLVNVPQLRHLVLRGNTLSTFDHSLINFSHLQSFDLRDNRLECNCSLKWLQEACQNKSLIVNIEEVLCVAPESLKGQSLSTLSEYDLECYSQVMVVASCVAASIAVVLIMIIIGVVYYKNCRKMKTLVHDNWPEKIVATWKDPEYEKQVEDEEYTYHTLRGIQHIPVTVI